MKRGGDEQVAKDVWASILEHIEAVSQPIYGSVNPPASEDEINQLENALNVQLPDAFRRYLSVWNGQHELVPFIGYNSFLPISDMLETWSMLSDMFEDFSHEILKRLETKRYTVADDVIAFDDLYFV